MNKCLKELYDYPQIVEVRIRNWAENTLVGYWMTCDKEGVILYNINYRGIGTGIFYLPLNKIISVSEKTIYLKKITTLSEYHQIQLPSYHKNKMEKLKKYLLNYFHDKKRMIRLNVREKEIIGIISCINGSWVTMETFDIVCGKRTGCSVVLEEQIEIFGEIQYS